MSSSLDLSVVLIACDSVVYSMQKEYSNLFKKFISYRESVGQNILSLNFTAVLVVRQDIAISGGTLIVFSVAMDQGFI